MSKNFFSLIVSVFLLKQLCQAQSIPMDVPPFEFIQTSIDNFSKGGRLYKKNTVFVVWVSNLPKYEKLTVIDIGRSPTNILMTNETKIGTKGKVPSRYIEKDGKLFFWWDNSYPLTKEALEIFSKYGLLEDDQNGILKVPSSRVNDSQKGAHYYFCKQNFKKFKKVVTNIGAGYYEPPKIKCN